MLLAADPGIRGCGCAIFDERGTLNNAAYVKSPVKKGGRAQEAASMAESVVVWSKDVTLHVDELALEWPRVYATRLRKGEMDGADPNDLLGLAGVDAAIAALYFDRKVTCYAPSDWKGQMTKEACHHRIRSRLSESEIAVLEEASTIAGAKAHNIWDAVGIGLHHTGRLAPRRVIPS